MFSVQPLIKPFRLSAETVKSQARKPKSSKGYHCSRNAYMLVYKRQMEQTDQTQTNVEVPGMTSDNFTFKT